MIINNVLNFYHRIIQVSFGLFIRGIRNNRELESLFFRVKKIFIWVK